jgi:hypothetical protein
MLLPEIQFTGIIHQIAVPSNDCGTIIVLKVVVGVSSPWKRQGPLFGQAAEVPDVTFDWLPVRPPGTDSEW